MRSLLSLGAGLLTAGLLLTGCAGNGTPTSTAPGEEGGSEVRPTELVGIWKVSGVEGENTWLRLAQDFVLWHDCGVVFGSLRVSGPLLIANPEAQQGYPECTMPSGPPEVPWLASATGYRQAEGGGWELLDGQGGVVATLTGTDDTPPEVPGVDSSLRQEPEVTPEIEVLFADPGRLPSGLQPVEDLTGFWVPENAEAVETDPFVQFAADRTWTGSDGCNGQGGRWAAAGNGHLIATAGPSTLIYCEGAPVGSWLGSTALAGMVDDELVLLDAAGTELGRLIRG